MPTLSMGGVMGMFENKKGFIVIVKPKFNKEIQMDSIIRHHLPHLPHQVGRSHHHRLHRLHPTHRL